MLARLDAARCRRCMVAGTRNQADAAHSPFRKHRFYSNRKGCAPRTECLCQKCNCCGMKQVGEKKRTMQLGPRRFTTSLLDHVALLGTAASWDQSAYHTAPSWSEPAALVVRLFGCVHVTWVRPTSSWPPCHAACIP